MIFPSANSKAGIPSIDTGMHNHERIRQSSAGKIDTTEAGIAAKDIPPNEQALYEAVKIKAPDEMTAMLKIDIKSG